MTRIPIITRVPIVTKGDVFQTIVSYSPDYKNAQVMGTYPTLESARSHYKDDMEDWRAKNGSGTIHYAIRQATLS